MPGLLVNYNYIKGHTTRRIIAVYYETYTVI